LNFLAVFIGGGMGSIIRFAISKALPTSEGGFPFATLTANALSCVVLGLAWMYFSQKTDFSPAVRSLIMVGFCGGFSTFSTFSLETLKLIQAGEFLTAATYITLSVLICVAILLTIYRFFN
jgi:CrcB protein